MEDVYKSPDSILEDEKGIAGERKALRELMHEQRFVSGHVTAFSFAFSFMFAILIVDGSAPLFIFLAPAIATGAILKYTANFIVMKHRIISSALVTLVTFSFLSLAGVGFLGAVVSFVGFWVCLALNRRSLNMEQEKLLYKWRLGKLSP